MTNKEPKRECDIEKLELGFKKKVKKLLKSMERLGYDPIAFETLRSSERQAWLYGIGRTHSMTRKQVTWTKHSRHQEGLAIDMISKEYGWHWPSFFTHLGFEAEKCGLKQIPQERCHIEQHIGAPGKRLTSRELTGR